MTALRWKAIGFLAVALLPVGAQASTYLFDFAGPNVSGRLSLTYEIDPNTAADLNASPNAFDPVGSSSITGVTGTVTDTAAGVVNATITGVEPLNRVSPEPSNLKAPNRFSLLAIANGVDDGSGHPSPGFHYDNILYVAGSPQTASDYPFHGGIFDIYGLAFTLDNGYAVNLWSNGVQPGAGLNYGFAITDRVNVLDYTGGVSVASVPEPATWALMLVGFTITGAAMRRRGTAGVRFA